MNNWYFDKVLRNSWHFIEFRLFRKTNKEKMTNMERSPRGIKTWIKVCIVLGIVLGAAIRVYIERANYSPPEGIVTSKQYKPTTQYIDSSSVLLPLPGSFIILDWPETVTVPEKYIITLKPLIGQDTSRQIMSVTGERFAAMKVGDHLFFNKESWQWEVKDK